MVQDMIANGEAPDESNDAMRALVGGYAHALNESKCPCGSEKKFADCCKREYQATVRGVAGLKREKDAGPKDDVEDAGAEGEAKEPEQDVRWCCHIGVDRKTGEPVIDVSGTEYDDKKISPQQIASIVIMAYHNLMTEGAFMLANGVYNRVMHDLGAAQAGARQKRRPPNRPVK